MRVRPLFCCVAFLNRFFFAREGGTPSHGAMGYLVLAFILGGFGVCVGVFWPHLGSSLEVVCLHVGTTPSPMGYPILGRFLNPIWCQLGAILGHFGARASSGWAGGVTRSANNSSYFLNFWLQRPMGYPILGPQVRWGTPFLVDFWTHFGANLAPSWATLAEA